MDTSTALADFLSLLGGRGRQRLKVARALFIERYADCRCVFVRMKLDRQTSRFVEAPLKILRRVVEVQVQGREAVVDRDVSVSGLLVVVQCGGCQGGSPLLKVQITGL